MLGDLSEWCWQQLIPFAAVAVTGALAIGGCVSAPDIAAFPLCLSTLQHMTEGELPPQCMHNTAYEYIANITEFGPHYTNAS